MKLTLRYEDDDREPLTIRITLTDKHVATLTGKKVLGLFSKQFKSKFGEEFDEEKHELKIAGGRRLGVGDLVADYVGGEAELYVFEIGKEPASSNKASSVPLAASPSAATPGSSSKPAEDATASNKASHDNRPGKTLRCKNFGCNQFYDPDDNEDPRGCRHHKAPPIFHETAKWWSCCPNTKAYDWEEFQKIPGCQWGIHCNVAAKKQVLGGVDLRASCAPQRIDGGDEVLDPRKKLEALRKAMLIMGVSEDFFDKAWGKLAARYGSLERVVDVLKVACEKSLESAASGQIEVPVGGDDGDELDGMD